MRLREDQIIRDFEPTRTIWLIFTPAPEASAKRFRHLQVKDTYDMQGVTMLPICVGITLAQPLDTTVRATFSGPMNTDPKLRPGTFSST